MAIENKEPYDEKCCIQTQRLLINNPCEADIDSIVSLASNRKIAEMTANLPYPYGHNEAKQWILTSQESVSPTHRLAIRLAQNNRFIGAFGCMHPTNDESLRIGYWIGEPHWGHGYATEAAHAVIDYIFSITDICELWGSCRVTNSPSRRVLAKCGFQFRNGGMLNTRTSGMVPIEHYVLERPIWQSLKAWGNA